MAAVLGPLEVTGALPAALLWVAVEVEGAHGGVIPLQHRLALFSFKHPVAETDTIFITKIFLVGSSLNIATTGSTLGGACIITLEKAAGAFDLAVALLAHIGVVVAAGEVCGAGKILTQKSSRRHIELIRQVLQN